mgnify:CR=1 FL=1
MVESTINTEYAQQTQNVRDIDGAITVDISDAIKRATEVGQNRQNICHVDGTIRIEVSKTSFGVICTRDFPIHVVGPQVIPNDCVAHHVHVAKSPWPIVVTTIDFVVDQFDAVFGINPAIALNR